jgi:hypothetical protein
MAIDLRLPPEAPNACPECKHSPHFESRCFGGGPVCRDWRGHKVPCLCVHDVHFDGRR